MTYLKTEPSLLDRRRFLRHTWGSLSIALVPGHDWFGAPRFGDNPFTLGVASGDPSANGIVLWTRLAPNPADPASLGRRAIPVGV
jgi:alkaline phosphatase D